MKRYVVRKGRPRTTLETARLFFPEKKARKMVKWVKALVARILKEEKT